MHGSIKNIRRSNNVKKMKGLLMRTVSLALAMLLILSDGHLITVAQANTATLYMATEGLAATALAASDEIILTPDFDPDGETILPDVIFAEDGDIPGFDPAHPSESPIPDGFPAEPGELPVLDVDLGRDTEILDSTPAEAGDIPTLDYVNEAEGEPADSDEPDLEYSLRNYEDLP